MKKGRRPEGGPDRASRFAYSTKSDAAKVSVPAKLRTKSAAPSPLVSPQTMVPVPAVKYRSSPAVPLKSEVPMKLKARLPAVPVSASIPDRSTLSP